MGRADTASQESARKHLRKLALDDFRSSLPMVYRRWVLMGIVLVTLGFLGGSLLVAIEFSVGAMIRRPDPWIVLWGIGMILLCRRGQPGSAAAGMLAAVWIDIHYVFAILPPSQWASAAVAVPVLSLITAMWLGGQVSFVLGAITAVSIPLTVMLSPTGIDVQGRAVFVFALAAAIMAINIFMLVFFSQLGRLLLQSQHNERRARKLIDDSPDAIIALSPDGTIDDLNPVAARLLGTTTTDSLGKSLRSLPLRPKNGSWSEVLPGLIGRGRSVEVQVSGQQIHLEVLANPMPRSGGADGTLLVMRDITERLAAERKNRSLQDQLQHAQKMEAVGQIAGGVAHDFNNLLTAIVGYGSLLTESPDPDAREFASEILALQERGAALVRQLLTFARHDAAKPRPVDLSLVLDGVSMLTRRLLGERAKLVLHTDTPCPIVADPGRLEQVVLNLAANARDAMPEGGVFRVESRCENDLVTLIIEDTGDGMSDEVKARIFEPFFTTKLDGKGTGLGLATVRDIVLEANGTIAVESTIGKGTRFELSFPRTEQPLTSISPATTDVGEIHRGVGQTVFVAEDNESVSRFLVRLLTASGYKVELAHSGTEANRALSARATPPDLLLCDVIMPGCTGPAVVSLAQQRWPNIPFLFMSGYLGEVRDAFAADFDPERDLIQKPFSDRELLARISSRLGSRDSNKDVAPASPASQPADNCTSATRP